MEVEVINGSKKKIIIIIKKKVVSFTPLNKYSI